MLNLKYQKLQSNNSSHMCQVVVLGLSSMVFDAKGILEADDTFGEDILETRVPDDKLSVMENRMLWIAMGESFGWHTRP